MNVWEKSKHRRVVMYFRSVFVLSPGSSAVHFRTFKRFCSTGLLLSCWNLQDQHCVTHLKKRHSTSFNITFNGKLSSDRNRKVIWSQDLTAAHNASFGIFYTSLDQEAYCRREIWNVPSPRPAANARPVPPPEMTRAPLIRMTPENSSSSSIKSPSLLSSRVRVGNISNRDISSIWNVKNAHNASWFANQAIRFSEPDQTWWRVWRVAARHHGKATPRGRPGLGHRLQSFLFYFSLILLFLCRRCTTAGLFFFGSIVLRLLKR